MLKIKDLKVKVKEKTILNGINLNIGKGEVHVIMGPNGSGKSTLSKVIMGHPDFKVVNGDILFKNKNILKMDVDEISKMGIFLGFQYPIEIPGISNEVMLREAVNQLRKANKEKVLNPLEFRKILRERLSLLEMDESFISRGVNEGFSGGEKKKNEILQMMILNPCLAILDEIDSGLDIDSLKTVCKGINKFKTKENSILIITHYNNILEYVKPDYVHIMSEGKIIKTGKEELAKKIGQEGFKFL